MCTGGNAGKNKRLHLLPILLNNALYLSDPFCADWGVFEVKSAAPRISYLGTINIDVKVQSNVSHELALDVW